MPRLLLARALTYLHRSHADPSRIFHFRRGVALEVPWVDYDFLSARGGFVDPDREIDFCQPRALHAAPPGTEVPVVRTGGLGDVLMVTIGLRELARRQPKLRISYATNRLYLPALRDMDFLARVVALEDLHGRFPYGIDLRGYSERFGNERHYRIDVFAKYLAGGPPADYRYPLRPRPEEAARGYELLGADGPWLGIVHRAAGQPVRSWPDPHQGELARLAARAGWRTVLLSNAGADLSPAMLEAGTLNLAGRTTVADLMCVLQALDVLVTPDTGTLHLGEALGVKTLALMSTVDTDARLRHYRFTRSMWAGLPCSPCYHQVCELPWPKPCMSAISPATVWREVEWMDAHEPPWPLAVEFNPLPVQFPRRPPLNQVARPARAELVAGMA
jgi:ADP-heptose:LPS heptosyltransferase